MGFVYTERLPPQCGCDTDKFLVQNYSSHFSMRFHRIHDPPYNTSIKNNDRRSQSGLPILHLTSQSKGIVHNNPSAGTSINKVCYLPDHIMFHVTFRNKGTILHSEDRHITEVTYCSAVCLTRQNNWQHLTGVCKTEPKTWRRWTRHLNADATRVSWRLRLTRPKRAAEIICQCTFKRSSLQDFLHASIDVNTPTH